MTDSKFSLRWNDFETNMTVALKELREEKDFFDVTIACEDSQIQAHKVILSACSTFFRDLLRRNPHQHPLLYLKGVKYKELLGILNFMYNGEVNVSQEELKQFLAVAGDLKIKGLTQKMALPTASPTVTSKSPITSPIPQSSNHNSQKRESTEKEPAKKRLRAAPTNHAKQISTPAKITHHVDNNEILEVVPAKPAVKESPKQKASPKVYYSQSPRKITQTKTPAPKILEQCILEADINTNEENEKMTEVAQDKTNLAVTPSRGPAELKNKKDFPPKIKLVSTPTSEQNWECTICRTVFFTKEDIVKHMREKHQISKLAGMTKSMKRVYC